LSRKIPWVVRVLMLTVLIPFGLLFFGVCDLVNWISRRVRR